MATGIFKLRDQLLGLVQKAWTGSQTTPAVEYLVVAGGGGGGNDNAGGGGGGGLLQGILPVATGTSLTVTVGAAGTGATSGGYTGGNGGSSVFNSVTAIGGGGGAGYLQNSATGASGGSGGGGEGNQTISIPGQGTVGQGNAGGLPFHQSGGYAYGGGGGGAGTVGLNANPVATTGSGGNGGAGIASAISGTVTAYAGGGGGGNQQGSTTIAVGGVGGGGNGGNTPSSTAPTTGATNKGGGGGGGLNSGGAGANGGSGICIISYPDTYNAPTTLTGTYTASTSGSGSMSFDGSTQYAYVTTNQSSFAFGSSNFTIEFWVYFNSTSGTQMMYDSRPLGTSGVYPLVYVNSGQIIYNVNSADRIAATVPSANAWHHIAVARVSTTTTMYVDGTSVGTYADSNSYLNGTNAPVIGSGGPTRPSNVVNGYMSNVRVNNTTAVYTTTFTPSTKPLTAISGTVFLMSTVSGAYLADSSSLSNTLAVGVAPTWNQASPFATGLGYKNRVYTWTASGTVTF